MPQHVRGDNLGPVRQVHLGGTRTASSRQPRRPGPPRAPPRQRAPVPGVPPRPAVEDRVRVRVDRLWRQAGRTPSTHAHDVGLPVSSVQIIHSGAPRVGML
jgi:hypothetical protein